MKIAQQYLHVWVWISIVTITTLPFWLWDWDVHVSGLFYDAKTHSWWLSGHPWLKILLYDSIPVLVTVLLISGLIAILYFSFIRKNPRMRLYSLYVILVLVLGPGLLVNAIFKDHWGRPRPIKVDALGGAQQYVPPLKYNSTGDGHSFPSGHSSVGFVFFAFWFLWRKRRPEWASTALIMAILVGSAVGFGRIAAGGHFLSDVLWSAWMVLFSAWLLYYPLLRIPEREKHLIDVSHTRE